MYHAVATSRPAYAPLEIGALQVRLETNFKILHEARRSRRLPVFAFEHGLSADERISLEDGLRAALRQPRYRPAAHWLAWIVYATELAYADDGDEYWRRFDTAMPGWSLGSRNSLRDWFETFASRFGGYRPVGRWAGTYAIISWPLCHALLPRDLQWQLGRTLYEFRYQLPQMVKDRTTMVADYIHRVNRGGSSRFENLIEQRGVVGVLVEALLDRRSTSQGLLCSSAVERIVHDIRHDPMAEHWFSEVWDACSRLCPR